MVLVEWSSMELIRLCRHPSIRTLRGAMVRSVPVGRSRFSRCCYLRIDLGFQLTLESWAGTWPQSPELGGSARRFQFRSTPPRLRPRWNCAMARRPHRSPTTCEAVQTAFERQQRPRVSWHCFLPARRVSIPIAANHCPARTVPECSARPAPSRFAGSDLLPCHLGPAARESL